MREHVLHPNNEQLELTALAFYNLLVQFPNKMPTKMQMAQELGVHPDIAEQWMMWFVMGSLELELRERLVIIGEPMEGKS